METMLEIADKRLKVAKARLDRAFDLLNRGNLTPEELRTISLADAEFQEASAEVDRLVELLRKRV